MKKSFVFIREFYLLGTENSSKREQKTVRKGNKCSAHAGKEEGNKSAIVKGIGQTSLDLLTTKI